MPVKEYIPIVTILILSGIIIGQNIAFMTDGFGFIRNVEQPYNLTKHYIGTPYPRVTEDMISVSKIKACIDGNYEWASFTDTGSMFPTFDYGHFVIQKTVDEDTKLYVGDIVTYKLEDNMIIHRVIKIKNDSRGLYYTVKGDNIKQPDPFKVRHDMIERVVVAVIY